ncbi:TMPRSS15 (predicted), partial [Pycnogonum litorale]
EIKSMKMATAGDIVVYDRRKISSPARSFALNRVESFSAFQERISDAIGSKPDQEYVICTPTRNEVTENSFSELDDLHTVYILNDVQQELPTPTKIEIEFIPHYDTLVKSGMYEYYASEGHNPLPFAFAELIDNSLAATASNSENRQIELHLLLDEQSPDKSSIYILDNGCGMTAKQLNDWAIYRLSKFSRKEKHIGYGCSEEIQQVADKSTRTNSPFVRRSLNSDISYFGVGGKQAIFFIGNSTRMITKPSNTKDVHELCISKKEFEKREKNKQSIYKGFIHNRKPGDFHHVLSEDEHLREIIMDEVNKDSFTCVVINGISPEHVQFSKQNYKIWCQQLAHIYHYYIHGPDGNNSDKKTGSSSQSKNINIEIKLYLKNHLNKIANLRDVKDDLPSQLNNSSSATFEFRAIVEGTGVVEGMLRYHPFLYDHETFPTDNFSPVIEEEHDYGLPTADLRPARGKRPIFECYWNGRLIPYTCIEEFDWCSAPKKSRTIPLECFNRISGVVWANDKFQVSTNKLTFMDLEVKLRDKNTIFCKVIDGQERRGNIDKHFIDWLKDCHENCDKQVKFGDFQRVVTRPELHRNKQYPWAEYLMINWDGKIFKQGQLVRSVKSTGINSQMCGTVQRFLLHGDHDGDTYATGGEVEILQEPQSIYDNVFKVFPLLKLDRMASIQTLNGMINEEEEKLPHRIILHWPEGDEVKNNYRLPAGKTIGAIKVEIANCRGDLISKLAGSSQRKLLVELRIVWHSPSGDVTVVQHVCQHAKNWPYWFR